MTLEEKNNQLLGCIDSIFWMAVRYADGRHSCSPAIVRDTVKSIQEVFPEWKPRKDSTLIQPKDFSDQSWALSTDYLHDLGDELFHVEQSKPMLTEATKLWNIASAVCCEGVDGKVDLDLEHTRVEALRKELVSITEQKQPWVKNL